jgi:hypothetical protein
MAKTLNKMLATGAIAATAMFGGLKDARADIAPIVTTTIHTDQDYDLTRDGIQIKYEWAVKNKSPPASDYFNDGVVKYTILSDLESKGMYDFQNNFGGWDFLASPSNSFNLTSGYAIAPDDFASFTALVDADKVIGNESVQSYSTSFIGAISPMSSIDVPVIPEPTTLGLIGLVGAGLLATRRFFRI